MRNGILRVFIFAAFALTLGNGVTCAARLDDGMAAYAHEDYETALKLLRPLAGSGNAEAQATLGAMYSAGKGVAQDFDAAIRWWLLAAAQGNVRAQVSLGLIYGVRQDFVRAYMWLSIAAARSYPNANVFRRTFAERMNQQQIAEAKADTRKCEASGFKQCD
jgi:uncharacterized protein